MLLNPQGVMLYLSLVLVLYPVLLIGVLSFGIYRMNKSHDVEKATHARYTVSAEGIETELLQREGDVYKRQGRNTACVYAESAFRRCGVWRLSLIHISAQYRYLCL